MKKERFWIAGLAIFLSTLILLGSFFTRVTYETDSRQAFVSVDINNLKQHGKNTLEHLARLKDAGAKVVTVEPLTVKGLSEAGRLELISYSSLAISDNPLFSQIQEALAEYPLKPENRIAIVRDASLWEYMEQELSYRYTDYKSEFLEEQGAMVFAFTNLTSENDLIVGYDYLELALIREANMSAAIVYPSYTFESPVYPQYFKEFFRNNGVSFLILRNNPYDNNLPITEELKSVMRTLDFSLVVWENENQIKNETPSLYSDFFSVKKYQTFRGFHMDKLVSHDESGYRYRYYQWFNSALERNTKFIHANLLENPGMDAEKNFNLTLQAISDFTSNLKDYSFQKVGTEVVYSDVNETACMAGAILLLSLLYLYLLLILKKIPPYFTEAYFGLMIVSSILSYACADLLSGLYALGIMIVGVGTISSVQFYLEKHGTGWRKYLWMVLSSAVLVIAGIISISALLGGMEYYTASKWFRGVVLSMLLPIVLAVVNAYLIYFSDTYSVKQFPAALWNWCKKGRILVFVPMAVAGVFVLGYYLIRTGNFEQIAPFEDNFRKWLIDTFYVRPRTKEFLFGYPLLAAFYYCSITQTRIEWKLLTGIGATVLFTSIFNTFCHTFTAVTVSIHRVWNGFLCGFIVSLVVIVLLLLIRFAVQRIQKKVETESKPESKENKENKEPKPVKDVIETKEQEKTGELSVVLEDHEQEESSLEEDMPSGESEETEQKPNELKEQKDHNNTKNKRQGSKPQNSKYPVKKSGKKKKKSKKK